MICPFRIIPKVDTWSNGEFRNIFKNTNTFLVTEKSVSLPFFDDILKRVRVHPSLSKRGSQPDESIPLTPSAYRLSLKRISRQPSPEVLSHFWGWLTGGGGCNGCSSFLECENNFPCIPAEPGFDY